MVTSVDEYNISEARQLEHLPNRVIEAGSPRFFNHIGYPTYVSAYTHLWRYADTMHEGRFAKDFPRFLGGLTHDEWTSWQHIVAEVHKLTGSWGRGITPLNALCRAMYNWRIITQLRPRSVVEIGPGSGYLSLLIARHGIPVLAVENAQAFYLWQERLIHALDCLAIFQPFWWGFYNTFDDLVNRPVDLVIANHCITEMHPHALAYVAALTAHWKATLFIEGVGDQRLSDYNNAYEAFMKRGVSNWRYSDHHTFAGPRASELVEIATQPRHIGAYVGLSQVHALHIAPSPDDLWMRKIGL